MALDEKYTDLINAAIDGEISAEDQANLDAFLAENADGRALYNELSSLCESLDGLDTEEPPVHLRHVIMNSIPEQKKPDEEPGFLQSLFLQPALRYTATFAAGVIVALLIIDSSQVSNKAFDDVTGLVGTVAEPVESSLASSVMLDERDVAGTVSLRSAGSIMIIDFDLVSRDPSIWFNGFAQLESEGTSVAAADGRVTLGMQGKRRYAVYLHNQRGHATTVNLRFLSEGEVVHEASLEYEPGN